LLCRAAEGAGAGRDTADGFISTCSPEYVVAVAVRRNVADAQVNAQDTFNLVRRGFFNVADRQQVRGNTVARETTDGCYSTT
jgi:hypothetical protein